MKNLARFLLAVSTVAALSACSSSATNQTADSGATTSKPKSATHYWYSESKTTQREYRTDNANCQQQTRTDASGELNPDSTSFAAYRDCMIQQGYSLRNYFF